MLVCCNNHITQLRTLLDLHTRCFFDTGAWPQSCSPLLHLGAMDVTKPYKFTRFGAMDATKPYKFTGIGAMDVTKSNKFIGFGAMDVTKPYKFIEFLIC